MTGAAYAELAQASSVFGPQLAIHFTTTPSMSTAPPFEGSTSAPGSGTRACQGTTRRSTSTSWARGVGDVRAVPRRGTGPGLVDEFTPHSALVGCSASRATSTHREARSTGCFAGVLTGPRSTVRTICRRAVQQ